jgi:opacity protein-like surface antigen
MSIDKRLTLVASIACLALAMVPAISAAQTSTTFGVKGGLTSATVTVEDSDESFKQLLGAVAGVFFGLNVTDNLALQVEGLVSQRGARSNAGGSVDTTYRLAYLDVPVLARLGSTNTNGTHFHVFTGPQFSVLINAKQSTEGVSGSIDFKDELKSSDLGWTIGAGVEQGNLSLDARYTLGLVNINASPSDGVTKSRAFAVMVGFRLQ